MEHSKLDVTHIVTSYLCHTCGACAAICPRNAVRYQENVGGYVVPKIDRKKCSACGLCYQVCPGRKLGKTLSDLIDRENPFVGKILSCEVGKATDKTIFKNGQSGGVLTALLTHLFVSGQIEAALIVTMPEAIPPRAKVIVATSPSDLTAAQKSKYSPVPMLQALRDLSRLKGRVAVVGSACRFHGLHNLLDMIPKLLHLPPIKLGLICDRVMTSAAIDFLGYKATKSTVNQLVWRDKRCSSYPGDPVIYTTQGNKILLKASQRMAIKDFFTPIRCRLCFDKLNIFADVVFGDPHGIKEIDRVGGETLVLARTKIGQELVNSAKDARAIILREISKESAVAGQSISQKRGEWINFIKAWQKMGYIAPDYSFPLYDLDYDCSSQRYHKLLQQGLALDKFVSRDELLYAANKWSLIQKIKRDLLKVTSFLRQHRR
ncbi:MAG: 4Fe-4S dicluster domain-containing protein [Candidatus Electrothrix sp. AX2]|nr:4Fe-4S dicluster domain-containing protein [Candidatus Electrothrix gigas]